jgi:phosphoglycerate dehydrogenase-like enzyme
MVDAYFMPKIVESGRITAALDVTDPEPLPDHHPLWTTPGVVIPPHVGAFTSSFRSNLTAFVGEQLSSCARGSQLRNILDRSSALLPRNP